MDVARGKLRRFAANMVLGVARYTSRLRSIGMRPAPQAKTTLRLRLICLAPPTTNPSDGDDLCGLQDRHGQLDTGTTQVDGSVIYDVVVTSSSRAGDAAPALPGCSSMVRPALRSCTSACARHRAAPGAPLENPARDDHPWPGHGSHCNRAASPGGAHHWHRQRHSSAAGRGLERCSNRHLSARPRANEPDRFAADMPGVLRLPKVPASPTLRVCST